MTRRRRSAFPLDQATTSKMHGPDSSLSTPAEAPEPKKKCGRPPGPSTKPTLHREQKPASRVGFRKEFVGALGKVVDVLESLDHDLDGDQEDGLVATNCNPDVVGRAERALHGAGDDDANPIILTSSTETQIPQQISREPRQPESINSANRETLGPVPRDTTKKATLTSDEGRYEALYRKSPRAIENRAALQTSDQAETVSSVHGEGEDVSPNRKVVREDVSTVADSSTTAQSIDGAIETQAAPQAPDEAGTASSALGSFSGADPTDDTSLGEQCNLDSLSANKAAMPTHPEAPAKPHRIWIIPLILVVLEHCPRMSPPNSYQSLLLCTVVSESSFPFHFDSYCLLAKRSCATGTESQDFQDETFLLPPFSYETPDQLDWDLDSYRH
ncbi:hypothetical protein BDR22DRAFT_895726 [Usnea florida]